MTPTPSFTDSCREPQGRNLMRGLRIDGIGVGRQEHDWPPTASCRHLRQSLGDRMPVPLGDSVKSSGSENVLAP